MLVDFVYCKLVFLSLFSQIVQKVADLQDAISEGATSFLFTEYKYMGIFMVRFLRVSVFCGLKDCLLYSFSRGACHSSMNSVIIT